MNRNSAILWLLFVMIVVVVCLENDEDFDQSTPFKDWTRSFDSLNTDYYHDFEDKEEREDIRWDEDQL